MKCGLLGRKLGHSYSPQIHKMLGSYSYALFEKEPEELEAFLKNGEFSGINVTVPYKKAVLPYLDEGCGTVGTELRVKHLAATPLGMTVTAKTELTAVEGRKLTFKVEAFDEAGKIGEGTHKRCIVNTQKFLDRTYDKL